MLHEPSDDGSATGLSTAEQSPGSENEQSESGRSFDFGMHSVNFKCRPVLYASMIKAIIFDLWDTMGSKGFAINKLFKEHFKIKEYPDYHKDYEESIQVNRWSSKEEMAKNFLKTFKIQPTNENIHFVISAYEKGIKNATLFDGMKRILILLKRNYKLGLVSNTTIYEINFVDKYDIRKFFDAIVCSHDVGKLKPSRKIFEEIAKRLSVRLAECLFIDDSESNTNKAKEYGMKTIRFESVEQLKKELDSSEILSAESHNPNWV